MSNWVVSKIARFAVLSLMALVAACAKSNDTRLAEILNIAALPMAAQIERCGNISRDGGIMWDCIVKVSQDDLLVLLAGHSFTQLSNTVPNIVYIAQPKGFEKADWIHILYSPESGEAAIATHAP